jgi:NAD+ diphosphatase
MNSETSDRHCGSPLCFIFDGSPEGMALIGEDGVPGAEEIDSFADILEARGAVSKIPPLDLWGLAREAKGKNGCRFVSRRELPSICGFEIFRRSGIAYQMMNMFRKNRFCGACGNPMTDHEQDRARFCPSCGNTVYPAPSPAVIVAVENDGKLLLGHNVNFPQGRYSILAGFVDPGETLEEAVKREIFEESGITVKNVRYFGSQPWPFPNSMMFGFKADWESGEPKADGGELNDVRWFTPDNLPGLPPPISISRQLIDEWISRASKK